MQKESFKDLNSLLNYNEDVESVFVDKLNSDDVKQQIVPMAQIAAKQFSNDDLKSIYATNDENGFSLFMFKDDNSNIGLRIKRVGSFYSVNVFEDIDKVTMLDSKDNPIEQVMSNAADILK